MVSFGVRGIAETHLAARSRGPAPRITAAIRRKTWKDVLRRRMLAVADLTGLAVAVFVASAVEGAPLLTSLYALAFAPAWILLAKFCGLYDRDHVALLHRTINETGSLLHFVTPAIGLPAIVLASVGHGRVSVTWAVTAWFVAIPALFVSRAGVRLLWRRLVPADKGLVIGSGPLADALARKLSLESGHHLTLERRITVDPDRDAVGVSRVDLGGLPALMEEAEIERVVIALQDLDEPTLAEVLDHCRARGVKLSVAPPLQATLGTAVTMSRMAELPLIEFRTWDPSRSTMLLKRMFDVCASSILLVLSAPLWLVIAIAIKVDSRGSVLFRQSRAGWLGEPFTMLKFRTMVMSAPSLLGDLIDPEALDEPVFKLRRDPRVTRVGRILRRTSIDELPQLVNVLLGQMSIVGPRPEETWLVERYTDVERVRLEMWPGITGPMQVHGRGELTFAERLAVERDYIENYSLRRDFEILLQTGPAVVRGRGAF